MLLLGASWAYVVHQVLEMQHMAAGMPMAMPMPGEDSWSRAASPLPKPGKA